LPTEDTFEDKTSGHKILPEDPKSGKNGKKAQIMQFCGQQASAGGEWTR
jgi:hypothetical protein